ncbi:hypothetical protein MBM_09761 [Drepanopeziza brunnea f. sp. 'multigermtubi' MB_m1]|uniref:Uncharacterized protein n=1 Tax=Marssonina brunnea f. sp. multigermtubi (strain MB_m1) TaxID=1072389 RepID=K1WU17_MARBU|nr:uncharacterized protein MBM_09761 [Drepanopeziza brunnea f. sp. 'multigermtubi' MB_m1]EKD12068.1 hypothetical protein MBM_09761 [Drepanopeziza brunnea f. sp. 'multigermtubi' MB_m1]
MPYYDHQSLRELLGINEEAFEEVKMMMQQVFLAHLVGLGKARLNCSPNKEKVDRAIAECIEGFQGFALIDEENIVPVTGMLRMYASMITNNKRLREKERIDGRRASTEPSAKKPKTKRRGSEDDMRSGRGERGLRPRTRAEIREEERVDEDEEEEEEEEEEEREEDTMEGVQREEMDTEVMVEAETKRKSLELDNAGFTSDMSAAPPAESFALPAKSAALPVESAQLALPAQSALPALPVKSAQPPIPVESAQPALPVESALPALPAQPAHTAVLGTSQKPFIHPASPSADIPKTFSTLMMGRKLMQGRHGSSAEPEGVSALHQVPALGMPTRHGTSIPQGAVATTTTAAARPALGERSKNTSLASARGFRSMQLRNQLNKRA